MVGVAEMLRDEQSVVKNGRVVRNTTWTYFQVLTIVVATWTFGVVVTGEWLQRTLSCVSWRYLNRQHVALPQVVTTSSRSAYLK